MSFKEKIIRLLDSIGNTGDVSFNYLYEGEAYQSALQFANQYQNISGVPEQIARLKENNRKYREQLNSVINLNYDSVNEKYHLTCRIDAVKKLSIRMLIIGVVGFIFVLIIESYFMNGYRPLILELLLFLLLDLTQLIGIVGVIGGLLSTIGAKVSRKRYQSDKEWLEGKAKSLNAQYLRTIDMNRKSIDQLYLGTLDPAHREVVLMRRDQERHHKEMLKQQERHNAAMLREQERTRDAQEEILRIEQERQERERRLFG